MKDIRLSKVAVAGTVEVYWNSPEFPEQIYICLEADTGFGEGHGGFGVGSVVNALSDLEGAHFFAMARIDELICNIPDLSAFRESATGAGVSDEADVKRFLANYSWEFAEQVNEIRINWE